MAPATQRDAARKHAARRSARDPFLIPGAGC
jgi:hypothetical protein